LDKTVALPALLYGSDNWTVEATDVRRITAAQMNYMRKTAGYTWTDYKTDKEIAKRTIYNTSCYIQTECPLVTDYRE
jgi:hypothetical protein